MNSRLITQKSDVLALAEYLNDWLGMAQGAFSANTIRAWRADWEIFVESCRVYRLESLPASSKTVRAFVFECLGKGKKPATVRRYVSTIGRAHRASGVLDPTASEDVRLALKEMGRNSTARQKQARGLVWAEIEAFLSIEPRKLRDVRDRALVAVAYDTMCRREELVSLLAEDISEASDGSASILIRRSKTDTIAEGAAAYLSPLTMLMLNQWITQAGIKKGGDFCEGSRCNWSRRSFDSAECNDNLAEGWAVDWAQERRVGNDIWPFRASRCRPGLVGAEH